MKKTTLSLSIAALLLTACGDNDSAKKAEALQAAEKAPATVEQSKEMSDKSAGKHQNNFLTAYDNIDLNQYKERVKTLSSDEFEGRAPVPNRNDNRVRYTLFYHHRGASSQRVHGKALHTAILHLAA